MATLVTSIDVQINEATRTIQGLERWLNYAQQLKDAIREVEELEQKRAEFNDRLARLQEEQSRYRGITAQQPSALSANNALASLRRTALGRRLALADSPDAEPGANENELRLQLASQPVDSLPSVDMDMIFSEPVADEQPSVLESEIPPTDELTEKDEQPVAEKDPFFTEEIEIAPLTHPQVDDTFTEILKSDPVGDGDDLGLGDTNWIDELAGMNLDELEISTPTNSPGQSMNDLLFSDIGTDPNSPWADPWNDMIAVADTEPPTPFVPLDDIPETEWGAVPTLPASKTGIGNGIGDMPTATTTKGKPGFLQKLFFR